MKTKLIALLAAIILTSCVTNTTTTTHPDGTVVVSTTKALDGDTVSSVTGTAAGYAIARVVRDEK